MGRRLILALLFASIIESAPARTAFKLEATRKSVAEDGEAYWFAPFDVGTATQLDMLIDTGSADLILNPNTYKPGSGSHDTGRTFTSSWSSPNRDGSPSAPGTGHVVTDNADFDGTGLNVTTQAIGILDGGALSFPGNGIWGLAGQNSAMTGDKTWLANLCDQLLPQCRFGISFHTDNIGGMVFGAIDTTAFDGNLVNVPLINGSPWQVYGDVSVKGQIIRSSAKLVFSSSNSVIYGPEEDVRALFQAAGMLEVRFPADANNKEIIYGEFDCNNPPQIGFAFHPPGGSSTTFNLPPAALLNSNANGKCKSAFIGTAYLQDHWLVGQAFYEGHYVDHSVTNNTMGFANLK